MNEYTVKFPTDGSAALEPEACGASSKTAPIIPFPLTRACASMFPDERATPLHAAQSTPASLRAAMKHLLDASEMYCSIRYEDFRGVMYGAFAKSDVRMLSLAGGLVAALSLAFGV